MSTSKNTQKHQSQLIVRGGSAIPAFLLWGISKNWMRSLLLNNMRLPAQVVRSEALHTYEKEILPAQDFFAACKEGTIQHAGEQYVVVYHQCTRYALRSAQLVLVSYRKAHPLYELGNYALVTPYTALRATRAPRTQRDENPF